MAGIPSLYRPGARVRENAPPHRMGTVIVARSRGTFATIFVRLNGVGMVAFFPAGLSIL